MLRSEGSALSSSTRSGVTVGRLAFLPMIFSSGRRYVSATKKQLLFLDEWLKTDDMEEAALAAGLTRESALRFLKRRDVVAWLQDLSKEAAVRGAWERPGRWYAEAQRMFEQERVPKHRVQIWQTLGERVAPVASRGAVREDGSLTLKVDAESIERWRDRSKSVDAQIEEDLKEGR